MALQEQLKILANDLRRVTTGLPEASPIEAIDKLTKRLQQLIAMLDAPTSENFSNIASELRWLAVALNQSKNHYQQLILQLNINATLALTAHLLQHNTGFKQVSNWPELCRKAGVKLARTLSQGRMGVPTVC